jgi:hypothetical protein
MALHGAFMAASVWRTVYGSCKVCEKVVCWKVVDNVLYLDGLRKG